MINVSWTFWNFCLFLFNNPAFPAGLLVDSSLVTLWEESYQTNCSHWLWELIYFFPPLWWGKVCIEKEWSFTFFWHTVVLVEKLVVWWRAPGCGIQAFPQNPKAAGASPLWEHEARLCTCCVLVGMACATNRAVSHWEELPVDMEYNCQQLHLNP